MIEAYNNRLIDQHSAMRHQTYLLMLPNLNKGTTQDKFNKDFWQLPGETDLISKTTEERYKRVVNGNKRVRDKSRG